MPSREQLDTVNQLLDVVIERFPEDSTLLYNAGIFRMLTSEWRLARPQLLKAHNKDLAKWPPFEGHPWPDDCVTWQLHEWEPEPHGSPKIMDALTEATVMQPQSIPYVNDPHCQTHSSSYGCPQESLGLADRQVKCDGVVFWPRSFHTGDTSDYQ